MESFKPPQHFSYGRYTIERELGTGTYGQVYLCHDNSTGDDVAVKVGRPEQAYRQAACSEIAALSALKGNPDSPKILDTFSIDDRICIVSELLDCNLLEVLRSRGFSPLSLSEVGQVAAHVLGSLAAVHSQGFIHCDVKPENIMLKHPSLPMPLSPANSTQSSSGSSNHSGELGNHPNSASAARDVAADGHGGPFRGSYAIESTLSNTYSNADPNIRNFRNTTAQACAAKARFRRPYGRSTAEMHPAFIAAAAQPQNRYRWDGSGMTNYMVRPPPPLPLFCRTCLIDFGAVRRFYENTYHDIQSLWYRAPEVLCGLPYTTKIDSWSVGCVLFELFTGAAFLPGKDKHQQFQLIGQHIGLPLQSNFQKSGLPPHHHSISRELRKQHLTELLLRRREVGLKRWRDHQWKSVGAPKPAAAPGRRSSALSEGVDDPDHGMCPERLELFIDFLLRLLHPDDSERLSCTRALQHPFLEQSGCCCHDAASMPVATPAPATPAYLAATPIAAAPATQMSCVMATAHPMAMYASPMAVPLSCSPVYAATTGVPSATATTAPTAVAGPSPFLQLGLPTPNEAVFATAMTSQQLDSPIFASSPTVVYSSSTTTTASGTFAGPQSAASMYQQTPLVSIGMPPLMAQVQGQPLPPYVLTAAGPVSPLIRDCHGERCRHGTAPYVLYSFPQHAGCATVMSP